MMEIDDVEIVQMELKYCEYCGGLWLRRKGDVGVCCAACLPFEAQLVAPTLRRSRPHLPVNTNLWIEDEDGEALLCGKGGNA
ncbi:MAG TPA: hypothetical protein VMB18_11470 [Terriglobales bacterium]|jgi:hypothetical protein|nr:hypothetical protein [Terriglobales bacterium]